MGKQPQPPTRKGPVPCSPFPPLFPVPSVGQAQSEARERGVSAGKASPAAQRRRENGCVEAKVKDLAQLSLRPGNLYTCSTVVLLKFERYSQRDSMDSHSREVPDSLFCSRVTLKIPRTVTWIGNSCFSLAALLFPAASLSCRVGGVRILWWRRAAVSRERCLHLFPLQTRSLTSHLLEGKRSSASTSKQAFYFLIVKAPAMRPKILIFSP